MRDSPPEHETFIGEPISPKPGTFSARMMATGGPGVPRIFEWRGKEYEIAGIMATWRTREPGHGMDRGYMYVRKHFYRVKTTSGEVMTIYFDRKPPTGRGKSTQRWHLFSRAAS